MMGTCFTPPIKFANKDINQRLVEEERKTIKQSQNTMTLLGLQSSGKTTLMQQQKFLQKKKLIKPYDSYLNVIRKECINTIIYLLKQVNDTQSIKLLDALSIDNENDLQQIGEILSNIWNKYDKFSNILSYSYVYNHEFQFNDNIGYFMDHIERIMNDETDEKQQYVLNEQDMIEYKTEDPIISVFEYIGEHDCRFKMLNNQFPKKHVHYHHDRIYGNWGIIYIAELSGFCEKLTDNNQYEEILSDSYYLRHYCGESNHIPNTKLQYALYDFWQYMSRPFFRKATKILMLNKDDIFQKRIRDGVSLSVCFGKEWTGPNYPDYKYNNNIETVIKSWIREIEENKINSLIPIDIVNSICFFCQEPIETFGDREHDQHFDECYQESLIFIEEEFRKRAWTKEYLYCHVITMTDHDIVEKVMWDVTNILIRSGLKRCGIFI